jgi:ketosteroid isomerase-like protein
LAREASPRLLCSHGGALFYIASHPGCTISDLADALFVTRRTVWGLVGELKRAGLINIRKEGRRHHYSIKEGAPFPDPLLSHATLGQFFQALGVKRPGVGPGPLSGKDAHIVADHPNAGLIKKGYDAFLKRDMATLDNLFAENVVWHAAGTSPISGEYRGRDAVFALFRQVNALSGGTFQIEVHTVLADDEHGVALTRATASREGKRLRAQSVNVFHVRDGMITEVWQASEDQPSIDEFWS